MVRGLEILNLTKKQPIDSSTVLASKERECIAGKSSSAVLSKVKILVRFFEDNIVLQTNFLQKNTVRKNTIFLN